MLQQININFRMINLGKQVDQGMFKGFSSTKYLKKKKENKKNIIILGVQSMLLLGSTLWCDQLSSNHRI